MQTYIFTLISKLISNLEMPKISVFYMSVFTTFLPQKRIAADFHATRIISFSLKNYAPWKLPFDQLCPHAPPHHCLGRELPRFREDACMRPLITFCLGRGLPCDLSLLVKNDTKRFLGYNYPWKILATILWFRTQEILDKI